MARIRQLLLLAIPLTSVLGASSITPPSCAVPCIDDSIPDISRGLCLTGDVACLCSSTAVSALVEQCIVLVSLSNLIYRIFFAEALAVEELS